MGTVVRPLEDAEVGTDVQRVRRVVADDVAHWKVTVGSVSEKVKLASPLPLGFSGMESIVGGGG